MPSCCSARNGHQEQPHTNALSTSAATGASLPRESAMHVVVPGDLQQVVHFVLMFHGVAAVPALDQPHRPCDDQSEGGDRNEGGEPQARRKAVKGAQAQDAGLLVEV